MKELEFSVEEVEEGRVVIAFRHDPLLERKGGILFGGFISLFFDVAMGVAVYTVNEGREQYTVTLTVDFLRKAKGEAYRVEGKVIKRGKNLVFVEGTMYADKDIVARARGIWMLV